MAQSVRDVMSDAPIALPDSTPLTDAARSMKDSNIGSVIVLEGDQICGIVTDRDIVIRAVADGRNPADATLADVCSHDLITISSDESVDRAVELMRERSIRRLPVVESGRPVGIVSLGDLAVDRDPGSALGDISSTPPNR